MGEIGQFEDDVELVRQSLAGDRDAFGHIVGRYQSLICSLAYSATGNLKRSQDLAQETFVTAWKQLHCLREPGRLRAWLCGIERNLAHNHFRKQSLDPVCAAEPLEVAHELPSQEKLPGDQAISREEEALLWRALEQIPETYREPLILFYREQQSVRRVAQELELSPEAVKQRLARGRKMLQEQVAAFVESTLGKTSPGDTFTLGVVLSLPVLGASSATAATVAGAGAKAALALKTAATVTLAGAVLGPVLGLLGAVFGSWASIKNTRSPRERAFMVRMTRLTSLYVGLFLAALLGLVLFGRRALGLTPVVLGSVLGVLIGGYALGLILLIGWINRWQRKIQIEDGTAVIIGTAEGLPSLRRKRWNVYGALGGGTVGSLAWLIVQAVQTRDWFTVAATVLFGTVLVLAAGRRWMKHPERRVQVLLRTMGLLGLFLVFIGALHWRLWLVAPPTQATARQTVILGCALAALSLLIAVGAWFRGRSRKAC